MYEEDALLQEEENELQYMENPEYFEPYEYEESVPSEHSYKKGSRKQRLNAKLKNTDKDFNTVKRNINGEVVPISYYRTGFRPGTMIRDAITGIHDPSCRVGKTDEYLYFKVCMASGEGSRGQYGESEPHHLYYDSPETYERHFHVKLDPSIKSDWEERAREERTYRNRVADEAERRASVQIH